MRYDQALELKANIPYKVGRFVLINSTEFAFGDESNIQLQTETLIGFTTTQFIAYVNGNQKLIALTPKAGSIKTVVEKASCLTKANAANINIINPNSKITTNPSKLLSGEISIYPNPVIDIIKLRIDAKASGEVKINLIDIQGRTLKQVLTSLVEGSNTIEMDVQDFPIGTYIIEFSGTDGFKYNKSFTKKQ